MPTYADHSSTRVPSAVLHQPMCTPGPAISNNTMAASASSGTIQATRMGTSASLEESEDATPGACAGDSASQVMPDRHQQQRGDHEQEDQLARYAKARAQCGDLLHLRCAFGFGRRRHAFADRRHACGAAALDRGAQDHRQQSAQTAYAEGESTGAEHHLRLQAGGEHPVQPDAGQNRQRRACRHEPMQLALVQRQHHLPARRACVADRGHHEHREQEGGAQPQCGEQDVRRAERKENRAVHRARSSVAGQRWRTRRHHEFQIRRRCFLARGHVIVCGLAGRTERADVGVDVGQVLVAEIPEGPVRHCRPGLHVARVVNPLLQREVLEVQAQVDGIGRSPRALEVRAAAGQQHVLRRLAAVLGPAGRVAVVAAAEVHQEFAVLDRPPARGAGAGGESRAGQQRSRNDAKHLLHVYPLGTTVSGCSAGPSIRPNPLSINWQVPLVPGAGPRRKKGEGGAGRGHFDFAPSASYARPDRIEGTAMSLRKLLIALCGSLLAFAAGAADKPAPPTTTYLLKADRVFDARSEATHAGWAVLVHGDRIAQVGPADRIKAPADAQVINLPGTTLLPGLIDAHSHIFLHPYNETLWNDQVLKEPLAYRTIEAVNHMRDTLMAGFTALRDLGTEGAGYADRSEERRVRERV